MSQNERVVQRDDLRARLRPLRPASRQRARVQTSHQRTTALSAGPWPLHGILFSVGAVEISLRILANARLLDINGYNYLPSMGATLAERLLTSVKPSAWIWITAQ